MYINFHTPWEIGSPALKMIKTLDSYIKHTNTFLTNRLTCHLSIFSAICKHIKDSHKLILAENTKIYNINGKKMTSSIKSDTH